MATQVLALKWRPQTFADMAIGPQATLAARLSLFTRFFPTERTMIGKRDDRGMN